MIIVLVIAVLVVAILVYSIAWNRQLKESLTKLNASRPSLSREEFISSYHKKGISRKIISRTYDEIYNYLNIDGFEIYPEDDLIELYKIDLEDLEDSIVKLADELNLKLPDRDRQGYLLKKYENQPLTIDYLITVFMAEVEF